MPGPQTGNAAPSGHRACRTVSALVVGTADSLSDNVAAGRMPIWQAIVPTCAGMADETQSNMSGFAVGGRQNSFGDNRLFRGVEKTAGPAENRHSSCIAVQSGP
jgi:hypothetical protein